MYRLITLMLLCANICIVGISGSTQKSAVATNVGNDTLLITSKGVVFGQKIYPQRDDVITACLSHEKGLYLIGKIKDSLLFISDAPSLFSNDAFCNVDFKHFKSPCYTSKKKKRGKEWLVQVANETDTLIFMRNNEGGNYSLLSGVTNGLSISCTFAFLPINITGLKNYFGLSININYDQISHVIIRPLKSDECIWYSKYDMPMRRTKSLFNEISFDKYQNKNNNKDTYIVNFK